jgi:hypothetical protein
MPGIGEVGDPRPGHGRDTNPREDRFAPAADADRLPGMPTPLDKEHLTR